MLARPVMDLGRSDGGPRRPPAPTASVRPVSVSAPERTLCRLLQEAGRSPVTDEPGQRQRSLDITRNRPHTRSTTEDRTPLLLATCHGRTASQGSCTEAAWPAQRQQGGKADTTGQLQG